MCSVMHDDGTFVMLALFITKFWVDLKKNDVCLHVLLLLCEFMFLASSAEGNSQPVPGLVPTDFLDTYVGI